MEMPQVHTCAQLVFENEKLRKCLRQMKRENSTLSDKLRKLEEKQKFESLLRDYVTTRDSSAQTDPQRAPTTFSNRPTSKVINQPPKGHNNQDTDKLNKMLAMHSGLMRKYEKELKINMQQLETIAELNLKVNELEQKLTIGARESADLRSQRLKHRDCSPEFVQKLRKERDSLKRDKTRLKSELKGLDQASLVLSFRGFFEEVEDIKFALQQSTKLNEEYEKCLKKICCRFGVPCPHPERNFSEHN
ncbi:hypothetical protein CAPTEDRAFT_185988 [Capitella teleta]|uniref:Uncharacterized protein n=1 Tax=Capitella teleta TaxID=283909 RepID=R7TRI7_CAPTE|nr:hypothetical protein CAPTEDRAFT_185988 [Capitella teleta]|eukprot:ELT96192.1 hypothetical protein CAPTEDRAFT_185988 [Capitella teleta]